MSAAPPPLAGHRVLVARTREQAGELSARVREHGGAPVEAPVLALAAGDQAQLQAAAHELGDGRFSLLALTSPNGVDALAGALHAAEIPLAALDGVDTVACVGSGTAARLRERLGRTPDLLPPVATTRSLGAAVAPGSGAALLPRADLASPELPAALREKGYEVVEVVAYRIVRPAALPEGVAEEVRSGAIDLVPLTSPSMARNLVTLLGAPVIGGRVVSIGPVTSAACSALGLAVTVEADPHDLDGLVAGLIAAAG